MNTQQTIPKTDKQAIESLKDYDGIYRNLAIAQFELSRKQGKSLADALDDARKRVFETANNVIQRIELKGE